MRLVIDICGIVCAFLTYIIVLVVDWSFIEIGLFPELSKIDLISFIHLFIMHIIIILIFWSHIKCMLTDPGLLPQNKGTELNSKEMSQAA